MKPTLTRLIDLVEESAFQFGAYGSDVLMALQAVRALWNAGHSSAVRGVSPEEFGRLLKEHESSLKSATAQALAIDVDFRYDLEQSLSREMARMGNSSPRGDALDEVVSWYGKVLRPKAFALLESLARQSDLENSKREKERWMLKTAELGESGVTLPPEVRDVAGFSAPKFKHLIPQIPAGQSIIDFYILNRVRHRMSRAAPLVLEQLSDAGVPRNIFYGTLELSTPGAETMPVEGADEYLVILSRALWSATSLATGIITRCVELHERLPAPINFHSPAGIEPYLQMLDRILGREEQEFELPFVSDERHKVFWEFLDRATKTFIYGHEYAHLLAGHLDRAGSADTAQLWNQELYADVMALQLIWKDQELELKRLIQLEPPPPEVGKEGEEAALQAISDVGVFHTAAGAALVLYLFWRMDALHGRSASKNDSHPPVPIRLGNMWTFIRMTSAGFENVFRFSNLMLRDFISLLPPVGGAWRDRFQEVAFRPLMFKPYQNVIDMIDKVNTGEPLDDFSLESVRARLESLFKEPGTPYEEKYSVLEECLQMVRVCHEADPLRSVKEAVEKYKRYE